MSIGSVQQLVGVLRDQRLLDATQLAELTVELPQFPEPRSLAKTLVQRDWLTPYQVNQIFMGKAPTLTIGKYLLLHRVGEGGMGQVFKARDLHSNQVVALKVLRSDLAKNPDLCKRFEREIRVSKNLTHPNIVQFYDAGQSGEALFFAMEFVDGIDLAKLMQTSTTFPAVAVTDACRYVAQAADGLQYAHEAANLVHRDIKPSNLLLSKQDGTVKILDLGLARSLAPSDGGHYSSTLTQDGMVMGTPDYIAPEQAIDSHKADIRADIYSLGCTFYFLLTGQPPFPQGSIMQKLAWHLHAEPPPVENTRQDMPRGLADVLRKMMAKKKEDRYQTPGEVADALEGFVPGGLGRSQRRRPPPMPIGDPIEVVPQSEAWAWGLAIAGSLMLLILGIAIIIWLW